MMPALSLFPQPPASQITNSDPTSADLAEARLFSTAI
jgi:hypothetical protein